MIAFTRTIDVDGRQIEAHVQILTFGRGRISIVDGHLSYSDSW